MKICLWGHFADQSGLLVLIGLPLGWHDSSQLAILLDSEQLSFSFC